MAWVKLDDHFDEHPKIARLDNDALALFVCGLAYCNRNLTDGFIPKLVGLGQLRYCANGTEQAVQQLEATGMWQACEGGWNVHDYDVYQPSRDEVMKEREDGRKRAALSYAKRQKRSSPEEKVKKHRVFAHSSPDPESRIPNPESLNPIPVSAEIAPEPNGSDASPSRRVWNAYREAYLQQYGTSPVRNAKVNGQIAQIVARLGEDAPKVAAWFLGHRGSWYVRELHSVGSLLRDCEKLHTEWVTGTRLHERDVREVDRLSADQAMWNRIGKDMEARKQ